MTWNTVQMQVKHYQNKQITTKEYMAVFADNFSVLNMIFRVFLVQKNPPSGLWPQFLKSKSDKEGNYTSKSSKPIQKYADF